MKKQRSKSNLQRLRKLFLERLEAREVFAGFGLADGAYFVEPWIGSYSSVAIQPNDQQIVVAGSSQIVPGQGGSYLKLARYDGNGTVDPTYGVNGFVTPSSTISNNSQGGGTVVVDSTGRAVVASSIDGNLGVVRITANGLLDSGFGTGGVASISTSSDYEQSRSVGIQSDGSVIVGGLTRNGAASVYNATSILAGFTSSGVAKTGVGGFGKVTGGVASGFTLNSFGAGFASFHSTVIQPDNKIVAVGTYSLEGSPSGTLIVARFSPNGLLDTSFNGNGYSVFSPPGIHMTTPVHSLSVGKVALQPDGKILITSSATSSDLSDAIVARYLSSGTLDPSFGNGLGYTLLDIGGTTTRSSESGDCVTLLPDGKILVAGHVSFLDDTWAIGAYRLNADGSQDGSFGGAGYKVSGRMPFFGAGYLNASQVAIRSDGSIVVAGFHHNNASYNDSPMLMRFFNDSIPTAIVTPTTGLTTSEVGGQATFSVKLDTQPTADVSFAVSSSDTTEGNVSTNSLTFTPSNWNIPQSITVTGVDDFDPDGNIAYTIVLGTASSADLRYNGLNPAQVVVTNIDNDTKFYVVNDATTNFTYEYTASGAAVENYSLNLGNTSPRGAASTVAGDKVWVVDANKNVYVYDASGLLLGSWTASGLNSTAQVEGITTNGTDVWLVDNKQDKVYKYTGAASRMSGSQSPASSFNLSASNTSPKDLVTDGTSIWVVNDSSTDMVFKYSLTGSLIGSWTISTPGASSPTGITLNPASPSELWIVDNGTDKVYQYDAAVGLTSGSRSASSSFVLAAGNTNPQGIADPPAPIAADSREKETVGSLQVASTATLTCPMWNAVVNSDSDAKIEIERDVDFPHQCASNQVKSFSNATNVDGNQLVRAEHQSTSIKSHAKRLALATDAAFFDWDFEELLPIARFKLSSKS